MVLGHYKHLVVLHPFVNTLFTFGNGSSLMSTSLFRCEIHTFVLPLFQRQPWAFLSSCWAILLIPDHTWCRSVPTWMIFAPFITASSFMSSFCSPALPNRLGKCKWSRLEIELTLSKQAMCLIFQSANQYVNFSVTWQVFLSPCKNWSKLPGLQPAPIAIPITPVRNYE